ncbi:MAG: polysaccharide deacetylase family protein [Calditrichaeota bacterium]|nr:polysaccharide deacetylase family protein [Calditrichota bacterium]
MNYTVLIPLIENLFPWVTFRVPAEGKVVFLTFDDGPDPHTTPRVLEYLRKFNATATFFVRGQHIPLAPGLLVQIKKEGHAIGNHGFSHISLWTQKRRTILEEIRKTNQFIEKSCGIRPGLFRPPYGRFRPGFRGLLKSLEMQLILWSIDSRDYVKGESAQSIVRNVLFAAKPGAVILLHDAGENSRNTLQALPSLLVSLQNQGYQFASLKNYLSQTEPGEDSK